MPVTIDDVLSWSIGELSSLAGRLAESATSLENALGGLSAVDRAEWSGEGASAARAHAEVVREGGLQFINRLRSASQVVSAHVGPIGNAQGRLRASRSAIAALAQEIPAEVRAANPGASFSSSETGELRSSSMSVGGVPERTPERQLALQNRVTDLESQARAIATQAQEALRAAQEADSDLRNTLESAMDNPGKFR